MVSGPCSGGRFEAIAWLSLKRGSVTGLDGPPVGTPLAATPALLFPQAERSAPTPGTKSAPAPADTPRNFRRLIPRVPRPGSSMVDPPLIFRLTAEL